VTPAVSVLVPTFQRREYVLRAVESVLAQTFEDFELIVVDDGSTDGTREALAGLDGRLRYEWQENRGVAAARNTGIRLARGDVVAFLDSDNRWRPEHLSVVTALLELHPQAVLATTCPHYRLAGAAPVEKAEVIDLLPRLLFATPVGFTSCIAVRRHALAAVGGFDERLPVLEDSDLWLRLSVLGPVCMLGRLTIEHTVTAGGLKERGIESGAYLEAFALSAATGVEAVAQAERDDGPELRTHALGKVALVEGVRAAKAGDLAEAGRAFAEACRRVPFLSVEPGKVLTLLNHSTLDTVEFLRLATATARLWPDPKSDTARYLWSNAFVRAVRARRPREAAVCLRALSRSPNPSFLVRTRKDTAKLAREWLHGRSRRDQPVSGRSAG
jgi:glycosyl transferase family 2